MRLPKAIAFLYLQLIGSVRIAHTIFVNDVQYMVFFSHHASLSISMMKLPLPSHPSLWEASNALEWESQVRDTKRTNRSRYNSLQAAVEAIMPTNNLNHNREYLQRFNILNPLSLYLLIHGIASAIGDLKYRSVVTPRALEVNSLMIADLDEALHHWLALFDRLPESDRLGKLSWNALLMYHFSSVLLRDNLSEIQMAAGSAFSSGRSVTPQGAQAAYSRLITTDPVGYDSYLHGLEIVSLCFQDVDNTTMQSHTGGGHGVSCVSRPLWQNYGAFLGILVLWARSIGLERLGKAKVDFKVVLRPLPPAFASPSTAVTLGGIYDRELSRFDTDKREVQKLKDDLQQLISTACERLTERPWEICKWWRIIPIISQPKNSLYSIYESPVLYVCMVYCS